MPATGSSACAWPTIWAKTGSCIAAMPSVSRSLGVLTLAGDAPLVSANLVCVSRIAVARSFMRETKASIDPASHRATVSARLLAEGMSIP